MQITVEVLSVCNVQQADLAYQWELQGLQQV